MKALKPQLCLDPSPKLDKLNDNPVFTKVHMQLDLSYFLVRMLFILT